MNENYEKNYWLILPDSYNVMNKILDTDYTDSAIEKFKIGYKRGLYVYFEHDIYSTIGIKRGHMRCPDFDDPAYIDSGKRDSSKMWLERNDYKFMGEISRKYKLEKLNNIKNV